VPRCPPFLDNAVGDQPAGHRRDERAPRGLADRYLVPQGARRDVQLRWWPERRCSSAHASAAGVVGKSLVAKGGCPPTTAQVGSRCAATQAASRTGTVAAVRRGGILVHMMGRILCVGSKFLRVQQVCRVVAIFFSFRAFLVRHLLVARFEGVCCPSRLL